ncbi:hypothetical protein TU94_08885 [Streptomyces cyaneogriseus subsp. noncyanogenus]|uniref:DUF1918 domain-containing protein n=1 Tax=Streptomyces cyaneogriseus subsp. noncyanogenus TaxID=477245 RepID=A0A0C5GBP3_9ACTN|nr:hypothetical protein [Streptomyces cyaneogriseus]AJP01596.1 hypothetical protein TU94_08885 [Streptomyces cyaneogriseus subsp. noncyanogenus]
MSGERKRRAWVGDLIHDQDADRRGIVEDVRGGATWVLRPEYGPHRWTSQQPDRLRVIKTREERLRDCDT